MKPLSTKKDQHCIVEALVATLFSLIFPEEPLKVSAHRRITNMESSKVRGRFGRHIFAETQGL